MTVTGIGWLISCVLGWSNVELCLTCPKDKTVAGCMDCVINEKVHGLVKKVKHIKVDVPGIYCSENF